MDMKSRPDAQYTTLTFSAQPFNCQISAAVGALFNLNAHSKRVDSLLDKTGVEWLGQCCPIC